MTTRKISSLILFLLSLYTAACGDDDSQGSLESDSESDTEHNPIVDAGSPSWIDEVQTYSMVPVLPEQAKKLHVTVNGLWGGIGGADPVITAPNTVPAVGEKFEDAASFVKQCRKDHLYSVGIINGVEGSEALKENYPNLDEMTCRDWEENPVVKKEDDEIESVMCNNNPDWFQTQLQMGKTAIDAGVDLINQDTPYGTAMHAGLLETGMCDHCMAMFQTCLNDKYTASELSERFDLETFDKAQMRQRLYPFKTEYNENARPFLETSKDALLFREFIKCHEQAAFDQRKALITKLRAYAAEKNREVAFTLNAAHVGGANPGGNWIRTLMFADLVDFFSYEQDVLPNGDIRKLTATPLPRGKWAPFHKLAYAIHHRRAPAVMTAMAMPEFTLGVILDEETSNTWMGVLAAEAYAADGAFTQFYVDPAPDQFDFFESLWKTSAEISEYVLKHRSFFNGPLTSGSPLAIAYLHNDRGRTIPGVAPSFFGLSTALTDGGYPYDVVFGGDGHYIKDKLTAADLKPYKIVLIPSPIAPTENQQQLLRDFADKGGTLVCQEPERLGIELPSKVDTEGLPHAAVHQFTMGEGRVIVLAGDIDKEWTGDAGAEYFKEYKITHRDAIWDLADALGLKSLVDTNHQTNIGAFPVHQSDRQQIVVHFVNYDIDTATDSPIAKEDISFRVQLGEIDRPSRANWYAPGSDAPTPIEISLDDNVVTGVIPKLEILGTLVIE